MSLGLIGSVKDKRLPLDMCMKMTIKEIRATKEYASLTPLGKKNKSGAYKYGNKSYLNKKPLCEALDNPSGYQAKILDLKLQKKNAGPRKRSTRKGKCPAKRNKKKCPASHPHKGLTTTGKSCCYKKKQSAKVVAKRSKSKK